MNEPPAADMGPMPTVDIENLQPAPAPEPKAPEPRITDELRERATTYGFSDEELEGLPPDQLETMVDRIEAKAFSRFTQLRQNAPWQENAPPQQSPLFPQQGAPPAWQEHQSHGWQPAQVGGPPQQNQAPQGEPFKIDLSADEYDEGLIKTLQKMNDHYQQQVAQITASLQAQEQFVYTQMSQAQMQAHDEHTRWFDSKISELGDDFQPVFGQGSIESLPQGSEQVRQRQQAYEQYLAYLEFQGLPLTTKNDELLARFVRLNIGSHPSIQQKQLSERLKKGASKTIGRPSSRRHSLQDKEVNPETGIPQGDIDELQRFINDRLSV